MTRAKLYKKQVLDSIAPNMSSNTAQEKNKDVEQNSEISGSNAEEISINLLINGNVNSFIEFFRLSHNHSDIRNQAEQPRPNIQETELEEQNELEKIIQTLTEDVHGSTNQFANTDIQSADSRSQKLATTSAAAGISASAATGVDAAAATLAAEAIVDEEDAQNMDESKVLQEKKTESFRTATVTSKIERVLCSESFAAKAVLPDDLAQREAFLDTVDAERTQRLLPLSTLKLVTSQFTELEACNRSGNHDAAFECLTKLGNIFLELNEFASSIRYFASGLETSKLSHNIMREYNARMNLAHALVKATLLQPGLDQYERAHKIAVSFQNKVMEVEAATKLTETTLKLCAELEDSDGLIRSLQLLTDALLLLRNTNFEGALTGEVQYALGKTLYELGNYESAIESFKSYLEHCVAYGDISKRGLAQVTLAACYEKCDKPEFSTQVLQESMKLAQTSSTAQADSANPAATSAADELQAPAKQYHNAVLNLYANSEAFVQLGSMKLRQKEYSDALKSLESAHRSVSELENERFLWHAASSDALLPFRSTISSVKHLTATTISELNEFGSVWKTLAPFNVHSVSCQLAVARATQLIPKLAFLVKNTEPLLPTDTDILEADELDRSNYEAKQSQAALEAEGSESKIKFTSTNVDKVLFAHQKACDKLQASYWNQLLSVKSHTVSLDKATDIF